jgi:hypothetical protein
MRAAVSLGCVCVAEMVAFRGSDWLLVHQLIQQKTLHSSAPTLL